MGNVGGGSRSRGWRIMEVTERIKKKETIVVSSTPRLTTRQTLPTPTDSDPRMAERSIIPDPVSNFKDYSKFLFDALISATKAANAIPLDELPYYKSLDRDFAKSVDACGQQILGVSNALVEHVA